MSEVGSDANLVFNEDRGALLRLYARLFVLSFLTIGFYRFWGRTRLRRYFLARISVQGHPLLYTGHGMEIGVSFVMALAALAGPVLLFAIVQDGLLADLPMVRIFLICLYFLASSYLFFVGRYAARGYFLSRLEWRGIRCGQTGNPWEYGRMALLRYAQSALRGFYNLPSVDIGLYRWRMDHTRIGDQTPTIDPDEARLMGLWGPIWIIGAVLAGLAAFWAISDETGQLFGMVFGGSEGDGAGSEAKSFGVWLALFSLYMVFGYGAYWVGRLVLFADGIGVGAARLSCSALVKPLIRLVIGRGLAVSAVGVALGVTVFGLFVSTISFLPAFLSDNIEVLIVLIVVPSIGLFTAAILVRIVQPFFAAFVEGCDIEGGEALAELVQCVLSVPVHGGGLQEIVEGEFSAF